MTQVFRAADVDAIVKHLTKMQSNVVLCECGSQTPHELHVPAPLNEKMAYDAIKAFCNVCKDEQHDISVALCQ